MAETIPMLALSPTMEVATIVKWLCEVGQAVSAGDVLCEVETDKAVMEYESPAEGTLLKILVAAGSECQVGDPIAVVGDAGEDVSGIVAEAGETPTAPLAEAPPPTPAPTPPAKPAAETGRVAASPVAMRLAAERGIDLKTITGTGPGGRIVKRDIPAVAEQAAAPATAAQTPPGEAVPVTPMRKAIARRMSESKFSAPHYYLTVSVGVDHLMDLRARLNEGRDEDRKLSLNAFWIKFAAAALARHPKVNASWLGETIALHSRIDVALAVTLDEGLVAPVVRDCDSKTPEAIDTELRDLIVRARAGELNPADGAGATFTISNLGRFGIDEFTAIINPPASAILAIGQIAPRPAVGPGGGFVVRRLVKLTLSCDHRVIDGAVGAAFLADLAELLGEPTRVVDV